jgi:hypothetical protein
MGEAVARTKGGSAAFIKEPGDLAEALDDMLFTGGRRNINLPRAAPDRAAANSGAPADGPLLAHQQRPVFLARRRGRRAKAVAVEARDQHVLAMPG